MPIPHKLSYCCPCVIKKKLAVQPALIDTYLDELLAAIRTLACKLALKQAQPPQITILDD